jgi:hypothetical protein
VIVNCMANSSVDAMAEVEVTAGAVAVQPSSAQVESVDPLILRFSQIDLNSVNLGCCHCGFTVIIKKWIVLLIAIYNFATDIILLSVVWKVDRILFWVYFGTMIINFLYDMNARRIAKKDEVTRALVNPVVADLYAFKSKQYDVLMEVLRQKMPTSARVALFVYRTFFRSFETFFLSPLNVILIGLTLSYGQNDVLSQGASIAILVVKCVLQALKILITIAAMICYPLLRCRINSQGCQDEKPKPRAGKKTIGVKAFLFFHIDRAIRALVDEGEIKTFVKLKPSPEDKS